MNLYLELTTFPTELAESSFLSMNYIRIVKLWL